MLQLIEPNRTVRYCVCLFEESGHTKEMNASSKLASREVVDFRKENSTRLSHRFIHGVQMGSKRDKRRKQAT
jgi:hypothetical protein